MFQLPVARPGEEDAGEERDGGHPGNLRARHREGNRIYNLHERDGWEREGVAGDKNQINPLSMNFMMAGNDS